MKATTSNRPTNDKVSKSQDPNFDIKDSLVNAREIPKRTKASQLFKQAKVTDLK